MVLPYDNMDYGVDEVGVKNITELQDVEFTNLQDAEVLAYNSSSEKWENATILTGAGTLNGLSDTNISSLLNGSFLVYNSTSGKWENQIVVDVDTLDNLTDTNISSVANGEVLKYNNTNNKWENDNLNINEINDVNITSLQNGEVLKYNNTSGKWENQNNTDTLNELTDVVITSAANNQVLKYSNTTSKFVNTFVNLTELGDTNISSLNNGDILRYNNTSQSWETNTFNIDDLDNTNISNVANNEVLKYNGTSGKWENSNRIDTLDELGDVTITNASNGDLLKYDSGNFVNTKIALNNDFTNVNFTSLANGQLIKYNGANFVNFSPTYLDSTGIANNYLIKVVGGVTTQTSLQETNVANTSTSLKSYIPTGQVSVLAGSIETEIFDTIKTRVHLTSTGINNGGGLTVTSDGRVGIGIVAPEEDLEINGSIQIDAPSVARLKFQKSGQNAHEEGEIDAEEDGTNGGQLEFYTKVDGGSVTEKLRINNKGAIGLSGANFGSSGQVIISNGSGSAVTWANQTDTVYTQGTGVTFIGTQINIGQSVGVSDSPNFNQLSLGAASANQAILNLKGFITNIGFETIAQIKGFLDGTQGGKIQMFTKPNANASSLTERLTILQNGSVQIFTDNVGLAITSQDGVTEQGLIYNSGFGTKDFTIDAAVGSLAKGIQFRTNSGNTQMRIGEDGNVGIGTTSPSQKLDVNGTIKVNNQILGDNQRLELLTNTTSTNSSSFLELRNSLTTLGCPYFRVLTGSNTSSSGTERFSVNTSHIALGRRDFGYLNNVGISVDAVDIGGTDAAGFCTQQDGNWILIFYNAGRNNSKGKIRGNGSSNGVIYDTSSDRRLKENITPMPSMLEKIKQLEPVYYTWKEDGKKGDGFIAQEVHKVFPQMRDWNCWDKCKCGMTFNDAWDGKTCQCEECDVENPKNTVGNDYIFGLDYGKFTPYLVKAMQEQQEIIERQETLIQSLVSRIENLEAKL